MSLCPEEDGHLLWHALDRSLPPHCAIDRDSCASLRLQEGWSVLVDARGMLAVQAEADIGRDMEVFLEYISSSLAALPKISASERGCPRRASWHFGSICAVNSHFNLLAIVSTFDEPIAHWQEHFQVFCRAKERV